MIFPRGGPPPPEAVLPESIEMQAVADAAVGGRASKYWRERYPMGGVQYLGDSDGEDEKPLAVVVLHCW